MSARRPTALIVWLTAMAWMLGIPAANAYIDAGTGSMIIQAVVAGLMAVGVLVRRYWAKISMLFGRGERATGTTDVR